MGLAADPDPRATAPQIAAWREAAQKFPAKLNWDYLIAALPEAVDVPRLRRVIAEWNAHGYNPRNVSGIVECYRKGVVNGNGKYTNGHRETRQPQPGNAVSEESLDFARRLAQRNG